MIHNIKTGDTVIYEKGIYKLGEIIFHGWELIDNNGKVITERMRVLGGFIYAVNKIGYTPRLVFVPHPKHGSE